MPMPPRVTRVSLSRLLDDRTHIRVEEAVAIVRRMWDLRQVWPLQGEMARRSASPRLPGLDELKLNVLGELSVHRLARVTAVPPSGQEPGLQSGQSSTSVMVLGQALQTLLDRGGSAASIPPWKLWSVAELAAVPWSFEEEEPRDQRDSLQTVDDFLAAIAAFGPADDKEALRRLFRRWEADRAIEHSRPTAWSLSSRPSSGPWGTTPADSTATAATEDTPAAATTVTPLPAPVTVDNPFDAQPSAVDAEPHADLRESRTRTAALDSFLEHEMGIVLAPDQPAGQAYILGSTEPEQTSHISHHGRAVRRRTLVAVAAFILIACVSYAATLALLRGATPPDASVSPGPDLALDGPEDAGVRGAAAEQDASHAQGENIPRKEPEAELPPAGGTDAGDANADEPAVVPQQPVFSPPVVVGQSGSVRPLIPNFDGASMYSPSFTANGDLLFHTGARDYGDLMRASASSAGFTVSTLLDDAARNYHAQVSPDGKQIAFDSDRHGERGVYVASLEGGNPRRISGEGHAVVPSWSPDGTRVAFARAEPGNARVWNIWMADIGSGAQRRVTSHQSGQPWGASWFPDGQRIAYSRSDRLIVLDLQSGESETFRAPRAGGWIRTPAVSPDGQRVVFQLFGDGAWLLNLQDKSMRRMLADRSAEEFAWTPDGQQVAFHSRRSGAYRIWVMSAHGG